MQIRIIKDKDSGESKGYAFIAFKTKEAAQKAIEDLHGKEVKVVVGFLKTLMSLLLYYVSKASKMLFFTSPSLII